MKRVIIATLMLAATLCLAGPACGAVAVLFDGQTSTGASGIARAGGQDVISCHVWRKDSASASTAVVYLQTSNDATTWFTNTTITNPTGKDATTGHGGERWTLDPAPFVRAFLYSRSSGTISATCTADSTTLQ